MDISHGFPFFGLLALTLTLAAWLWKSLVHQRRLERRLADLCNREQRLRRMLSSLPDPTFAVDNQSRIILWNTAMERLTGVPATAVLGKGDYEYAVPFHGERRPIMIDLVNHWDAAIAARYSNLLRLDDLLVAETLTHTPPLDGRYIRIVAGPLRDEAGKRIGAIESLQDITHRRMSLKVLEGREELLRILVNHMPLAVAMCDRQMKYLYYNRRWVSDLGLPDIDYIGRSHYDAIGAIPDQWKSQHARCLNGETIESQAEPFTRADGRVEWLKRIMHPWRTSEGEVGGIIFLKEVITAEKRAEQAAQEMDRRLQAIGNNLPGGVLFQQRIRPDGSRQFTYISQSIEKRHGVTAAAVMDDAGLFFQHMVPKDLERLARAEARASQTLAVLDEIVQFHSKSGKTGWERIVAQPSASADGGTLFDGMLLDITIIKMAETNLRLMEHVLQNSPAVLFRWLPTENWPVDYVSENISQFGHSAQALISGEVTYAALVHPDDRSRVVREVSQYETAGAHHFQQEYRILTQSGASRWVDDRTVIERDQDGSITHFMGVVIDITDRKQAQQETVRRQLFLESVLHHAPDAIITLDDRNRVVDWNPGAQTLFGYTPGEAIGQPLVDLVTHGDDALQSAVTQNFQMAISGKRVEPVETVRYRKDGRAVNVITAGSPILIDGILTGVVVMYTDITALKKVEGELRMTQFSFDKAAIGIYWIRSDGSILNVNDHAAASLGYTKAALTGMSVWDIDAHVTRENWASCWQRALGNGLDIFETIYLSRDGRRHQVEIYSNLLEYKGQQYLFSFVKDIGDRKRAEAAMVESNRMLRLVLDTIPVRVFWKDRQCLYMGCNRAFAEDAGFSEPGELIGHDDDAMAWTAQAAAYRSDDRSVMASGVARLDYEEPQTTPDGRTIWLQTSKVPMRDHRDNVIGLLGTYQDITERKTAVEELQRLRNYLSNIINSMPSVLVGVDREGRVTQWNTQAERITGIPLEAARAQPLESAFPQLAGELERIRRAIRDRQILRDPKIPRKQKGEIRFEDVTIFPLVANGVEGAVIRVDDVTERVRMEEMMIQSEKMLSVGGLAAGMAHEINNPLAGILQNAAVLENRLLTDLPANLKAAKAAGMTMAALRRYMQLRGLPDMLANIRGSGNRAAEIVKNMLNFSRKTDHAISSHRLGDLLDQTLDLARTDYDMKKNYDFKQILIQREYDPAAGPVPCEASKLQQVFLNILKNGAEAMAEVTDKRNPPRFTLRVIDDDPWVRVEIEDNGPGMDETTRRRIFEPFFTTKPVGEGTGLGLSISYFIITENHGGTMDVRTSPDKGACFVIQLPKTGKPS